MFGHESVVGHAQVSNRASEDAAHGDLASSTVAQPCDRVASVPHGMTAIVQEPLRGTVALHERPDPV